MLHGIINEQEYCLDVRDGISEKMNIFHMLTYKSKASSAIIIRIIVIANNKPMYLRYRCCKLTFYNIFPNAYTTKI